MGTMFGFDEDFDYPPLVTWTQDHMEVPIFFIMIYLAFLFTAPDYVPEGGFHLKKLWSLWNLFLSVFSLCGAISFVPFLIDELLTKGFRHTVCSSSEWYMGGDKAFWMSAFIYSKYFELLDTVFLVLRGKKVIFLHWYHHITVLLYCCHAYATHISNGVWFAGMNYSVHSIMYAYYFFTSIGYYKLVSPIAPFITFIQIAQMVGGIIVLSYAGYIHINAPMLEGMTTRESLWESCATDPANWKMGLMMYFSYFCLFVQLFKKKYFDPKEVAKGKKRA